VETAKFSGRTQTVTTERYLNVERSRLRDIEHDIDPQAAV